MKRFFKWTGIILATPIILFMTAVVLLYIPPIQDWIVVKVTDIVRKNSGMTLEIGRIRLSFPTNLKLEQLTWMPEDSTMEVKAGSATIDLDFSHILKRNIGVNGVTLEDGWFKMEVPASEDSTTSSPLPDLNINVNYIRLKNCGVDILLPADSIHVRTGISDALLKNGVIRLNPGIYSVGNLDVSARYVIYDAALDERERQGLSDTLVTESIDWQHVRLSDVSLSIDDFHFQLPDNNMSLRLSHAALLERCGLELKELRGDVKMVDEGISLSALYLKTGESTLQGDAHVEWQAIKPEGGGHMSLSIESTIGKKDIMTLGGTFIPKDIKKAYPDIPLSILADMEGDISHIKVNRLKASMPECIELTADGWARQITDSLKREAYLQTTLKTFASKWTRRLTGSNRLRIPTMTMTSDISLKGNETSAELFLKKGKGWAKASGRMNIAKMVYQADLKIENLMLHDILPQDSLFELTARASAKGVGNDPYSPHTRLKVEANIDNLHYAHWNVDNVKAHVALNKGKGYMEFNSDNDLLELDACIQALVKKKGSDLDFDMDMRRINLYALGLTHKPMSASMVMQLNGTSNLADTHSIEGSIKALELTMADTTFHPLDIYMKGLMDKDTISADIKAGDLVMDVKSGSGLTQIMKQFDLIGNEFKRQLAQYELNQDTIRTMMPKIDFYLKTGENNPLCNYLKALGYGYQKLEIDISTDKETGLNGTGYIHELSAGNMLLDTIHWNIFQDSTGVNMDGRIRNGKKNRTATFESLMRVDITPHGAVFMTQLFDEKKKKSVDIGIQADVMKDGIKLHLTPLQQIIAYRTFTLNPDNFVKLSKEEPITAMIDLIADDKTGLKLYSTPNEEAEQDLSLSINNFNLGELSDVIPYMPDITGLLNGDIHYMRTDSVTQTLNTDLTVNKMTYNGSGLGDIGINAIYLPNADGTQYVDILMTQNDNEIATANGLYLRHPENGTDSIEVNVQLTRLPINLANAFLPKDIVQTEGYATGMVELTGSTDHPRVNGMFSYEDMVLSSKPYNIILKFPNDTILINENKLELNRIITYAQGNSPMTLDGDIDFSNMDDIFLNLNVRAKNYKLIDAPKSKDALTYGQVYVDILGLMQGPLNKLSMHGKLTVLGKTDVTYVLKDSPITVEDELADLVTFMDFSDTTRVESAAIEREYIDLQLQLSIEQAAQVHCLLNESGDDYINIEGGGDLNLSYDTENGFLLNGRYTIINGDMNYTILPVIGSKHFNISNGSYVEFRGNMENPILNVSARERVRTSVSEGQRSKPVNFDVGLRISQTLKNMGLEFTLDAPEDMTIQNELAAMSTEEKGRVAVTLLATGMYVTELTKGGGFSTTNTLNSYLQSEINSLIGKVQNTVDINVGIEKNTTETGGSTTDYSFSFAKRFWGNRITLMVGGKIQTGSEASNTGQSIIDNVSLEYRLDQNATRYVKLYYDRNYESLLEGELTEMGAGVVFRRKTDKLGELFIFKKKKEIPAQPVNDKKNQTGQKNSVTVKKDETTQKETDKQ